MMKRVSTYYLHKEYKYETPIDIRHYNTQTTDIRYYQQINNPFRPEFKKPTFLLHIYKSYTSNSKIFTILF